MTKDFIFDCALTKDGAISILMKRDNGDDDADDDDDDADDDDVDVEDVRPLSCV